MATTTGNTSDTVPAQSFTSPRARRILLICLAIIALTAVVDVMFLRSGGLGRCDWIDPAGTDRRGSVVHTVHGQVFAPNGPG